MKRCPWVGAVVHRRLRWADWNILRPEILRMAKDEEKAQFAWVLHISIERHWNCPCASVEQAALNAKRKAWIGRLRSRIGIDKKTPRAPP